MKYFFLVFALFSFPLLQAQVLSIDELTTIKNMDSDEAIETLEKSNFDVQSVFENQMYFVSTAAASDSNPFAVKLVFEAEKDGPNILKVISVEFAMQDKTVFNGLKTNFKENPKITNSEKISATLESQNENFPSAVEKSTFRAEYNGVKEFFSFARFIPPYPIYKERNINFEFTYTVTIQ
jgi:hypothetical protein